jgi:membrane protease YdiL (CAAX protease family)
MRFWLRYTVFINSLVGRLMEIRSARVALLLLLALMPWPLVAFSLHTWHRYDLAFLLYHGLCLGAFCLLGTRRLSTGRSLLRIALASFAVGLLGTLVVGSVVDLERLRTGMERFGFAAAQLPLMGLYFVLVHPLLEEAFWRGTIFERLSRDLPAAWALGLSSLLFGSWHALVISIFLPTLWVAATAVVVLFGVAMALIYHHSGRDLAPCTLVHAMGGDLPLLIVLGVAFVGL